MFMVGLRLGRSQALHMFFVLGGASEVDPVEPLNFIVITYWIFMILTKLVGTDEMPIDLPFIKVR
jgi:hypothetical protein